MGVDCPGSVMILMEMRSPAANTSESVELEHDVDPLEMSQYRAGGVPPSAALRRTTILHPSPEAGAVSIRTARLVTVPATGIACWHSLSVEQGRPKNIGMEFCSCMTLNPEPPPMTPAEAPAGPVCP